MKQLIRRFTRVSDSAQYSILRDESSTRRRRESASCRSFRSVKTVPEGHVPVYVGDEMERFVVSAKALNHPVFVDLLNRSAQEYGYENQGVLRIPCNVFVFERVLEGIRRGSRSRQIEDLLGEIM